MIMGIAQEDICCVPSCSSMFFGRGALSILACGWVLSDVVDSPNINATKQTQQLTYFRLISVLVHCV